MCVAFSEVMTNRSGLLAEMHARREYRVCKDNHDPRGWPVRTADNRELGKVSDLIIDEEALSARYLVCSFALEKRRVLIPTGFARLDERGKVVHLDFITREEIAKIPSYNGLPLTEQEAQTVETALTGRDHVDAETLIKRRSEPRSD
jgi:hypothetical protein